MIRKRTVKRMNNVSLYSVTPETGGIFSALDFFSVPWKNTVNAELIDLQYYGNVSGEKIISPLVYKNLSEGKLTTTKQALIASMIFSMFGTNWTKEWNTLSMQYDPIANYDMTETMTDDETVTEYGKTHTKTGTETDAPNLTVSTSDTVHGFNSSNAVPTDARSQGTSGSDITTYDTSDADSGEDTQTRNYELTRKGNIGVTSSQQLLESERNLWMWNYFLDVVFPDVDKILTIPIYADPEEYTETGIVPTGTISINENGLQIDVKQYAFADVAVPNTYTVDDQGKVVYGDLLIGQTSRTITENGEYDTTLNNDCTVNVPNTYTQDDEGKVVSDGSLVQQTALTVAENGTFDTTLKNSVTVNVPTLPVNIDFRTIGNRTINNVSVSSSGAVFDGTTKHIDLISMGNNDITIEVDVASMDLASGTHRRFIMSGTSSGLIFRSTGVWALYDGSNWYDGDFEGSDQGDFFDDSIVKVYIDATSKWHIYKDNVLVFEPDTALTIPSPAIGSTSNSINNVIINSVKMNPGSNS